MGIIMTNLLYNTATDTEVLSRSSDRLSDDKNNFNYYTYRVDIEDKCRNMKTASSTEGTRVSREKPAQSSTNCLSSKFASVIPVPTLSSKKKPLLPKCDKSELYKWVNSIIPMSHNHANLLIHSCMYTKRTSHLLKYFLEMHLNMPVNYDTMSFDGNISRNTYQKTSFRHIFIDGVLEHIPNMMAQALFLRSLLYGSYTRNRKYLILRVRSNEIIKKEAIRNNYPSVNNGYLITGNYGVQSIIEGMSETNLLDLLRYARISKKNYLDATNIEHSRCIILTDSN